MLRYLAPLLAVALAACASMGPGARGRSVETGALLGLTQTEVRARLGFMRGDGALHFTTLSLENGIVVAQGDGAILADPNPCRGDVGTSLILSDGTRLVGALVFHDGRLAEVRSGDVVLAPQDRIQMLCHRRTRPWRESDILGLPFVVVGAVMAAPAHVVVETLETGDERARARALADLRFGGPLPGGAAGYAAAHPESVRLIRAEGDDADLALSLTKDAVPEDVPQNMLNARHVVLVEVRGGIVTRVAARRERLCRLMADQRLACRIG